MATSISTATTNFHLSLNVANMQRSIEFFSRVLGASPAKQREDYAKFEIDNPPLTLALEPTAPSGSGALNHVGFRLASHEELLELQRRLEMAGISSETEEGVECCYSRQTKFWLRDPDQNLWEFYVLEEDIAHRGGGQELSQLPQTGDPQQAAAESSPAAAVGCCGPQGSEAATACSTAPEPVQSLAHRLTQPLPDWQGIPSHSLDRIDLQGTLNDATFQSRQYDAFFQEVARVLKPGGRLALHNLTARGEVDFPLELPGPAAVVKHVPDLQELLHALTRNGFVGSRLMKYRGQPCFVLQQVEMRETMLEAFQPWGSSGAEETVEVVYKGPLAAVRLDDQVELKRGCPTAIAAAQWKQLQESGLAGEIEALLTPHGPIACGS